MCTLIGLAFQNEINLWKLLIAKTIDVIDANRNKSVKFYWIQFSLKIVIESNWNINFTVLFAFENQIKLFVGLYSCKIEILFTQIELFVFFFRKKIVHMKLHWRGAKKIEMGNSSGKKILLSE